MTDVAEICLNFFSKATASLKNADSAFFGVKRETGHMTLPHMLSVGFSHSGYFVGYLERAEQELSENIYIYGAPMYI